VKVAELGEFGLIQRLRARIGAETSTDLIVGIGDDCAVWRSGAEYILATTDALVEGVHFMRDAAAWEDVGWKAMAVNVSDIAAMGGEPLFALVTLGLPGNTEADDVDALYSGLLKCASEYDCALAGGDIVRANEFSITVGLTGKAQMRDGAPLLMRRDAAKVGDIIAVTGALGGSAAGLRRMREGITEGDQLVSMHVRPLPPLGVAQEAARLGVRCAIDVSDGLLQDLGHICTMSGVSADVRSADVPINEAVRSAYPDEALAMACAGGEDYEVVVVATSGVIQALCDLRQGQVTVIGRVTEGAAGQVRLLDPTGAVLQIPGMGWDHLRAREGAE